MADNKKITDLTELTSTAGGDYLAIVDVSDTTDDPAGTSKKILKSNIETTVGVNVKDYGAVGDGVVDDTTAIQSALDTGDAVYFPQGTYKITSSLHPGVSGNNDFQLIQGAGMKNTIIVPTGAINGFVSNPDSTYTRVTMKNFSIIGDSSTLNGIYFEKCTYWSLLENIEVSCGGNGVYIPSTSPQSFNYTLKNVYCSSYNEDAFNLYGGNTTLLENCAASAVPTAGKCGYRIWNTATLISCNGIFAAGCQYWGIFGAITADEGSNKYPFMTLINCNIEATTYRAIWVKNDQARICFKKCVFQSAVGYDCDVYIHTSSVGNIIFDDCYMSTNSPDKLANVYMANGTKFFGMSIGAEPTQYDLHGTLTNLPRIYSNGTAIVTV